MRAIKKWTEYFDQKSQSIEDPIELADFCVGGKALDARVYRKAILEPTLKWLELEPHHHFLEVGCGSGLFLREVENNVARCVGVDISERLLSSFPSRAEKVLCAAHDLPFNGETFDRILMYSVTIYFESFDYFKQVANKCVSLLKKNGIYLIGDLLLGPPPPNSRYTYFKIQDMIDYLDSLNCRYNLMAQSSLKRTINRRYDVIIFKD